MITGVKQTLKGEFVRWTVPPSRTKEGRNPQALLRVEVGGELNELKVWGRFHTNIKEGEWVVITGKYRDSQYVSQGRQFREIQFDSESVYPDLPTSEKGVLRLLSSTFDVANHGVTEAAIKTFVSTHGANAALAVSQNPELLLSLTSNPSQYRDAILRSWNIRVSAREPFRIMELAGVDKKAASVIVDIHRDMALDVMKSDPYDLIRLKGVNFPDADKLGKYFKFASDHPARVSAAISVGINGGRNASGNTAIALNDLFDSLPVEDISKQAVLGALKHSANESGSLHIHQEEGGIFIQKRDTYIEEKYIATRLAKLVADGLTSPKDHIDAAARQVLAQPKYKIFDDIQLAAVIRSAREKIAILTGGPGTGKSTVTEAIAEIASLTSDGPVLLCAPTGKAGVRLAETTKKEAMTIHKLLEAGVISGMNSFNRNGDNQLPAGCKVIIDEASMIDVSIMSALLEALPDDGSLLLVGDKYQLPSVGPGYVIGDMIAAAGKSGASIPVSELINFYRAKDDKSLIGTYATEMKNGVFTSGKLNNIFNGGIALFDVESSAICRKIQTFFSDKNLEKLGSPSPSEIVILTPQRTGAGGTYELNAAMSKLLNPRGAAINRLPTGGDPREPIPRVGDRVMMTRNDYEKGVMNGDVGTIKGLTENGKEIVFKLDTGAVVNIPVERGRELILAYAITGHKSQGSQYKVVIMPFSKDHENMLDRTLVYTEWTRAKKYILAVGSREVFDNAIKNTASSQRSTMLKSLLSKELSSVPYVKERLDIGSILQRSAGVNVSSANPTTIASSSPRPAGLGRPASTRVSNSPTSSRPAIIGRPGGLTRPSGISSASIGSPASSGVGISNSGPMPPRNIKSRPTNNMTSAPRDEGEDNSLQPKF